MTANGNHGGSLYEETDALALFIGLENSISDHASATHNSVHQVDIAPTLALLFGVPIPKNNVGVLISETFDCSTDDKKLRALELNSWQLLRLVQDQLPNLYCQNFLCNGSADGLTFSTAKCGSSTEEILCCLYMNASILHNSWKSNKASGEDLNGAVAAYIEFLKTASEWLSRRVTDVGLLVNGY
uniref:Uncharacterized protein n=1 Tax=Rhizophora mucronata TaxID=61149 RepID=A0A2P2N2I9_RHIMU